MLMKNRWQETNPDNKTRILWDMALVQAYLRPELVQTLAVNVPPENMPHKVKIYTKVNFKGFYDDFWGEVEKNRKR